MFLGMFFSILLFFLLRGVEQSNWVNWDREASSQHKIPPSLATQPEMQINAYEIIHAKTGGDGVGTGRR